MSTENIDSEINRIKQNISDSYSELSTLGATIPATKSADNLATCASTLQTSHIITQNGDNLVTNYGTNINHDGKNTIKSLALSQRPEYLNFLVADDANSTVKFSLDDLKNWIYAPPPSDTTLHLYDRVDDKATVAGFWTDGEGWRYAICVVDAAYRSGSALAWSTYEVDTVLPNYSSVSEALEASECSNYNTETILNIYAPNDYPAFKFARFACMVTVEGRTYLSQLPNLAELKMIYDDRVTLDTYDPTLSEYSSRSLTSFQFDGSGGAWSSTEHSSGFAWDIFYDGSLGAADSSGTRGVCPVIEIRVDENGTVIKY